MDRAREPWASVEPVVLRSSFQEELRTGDGLALTQRVDDRLRAASSAPRGAKLVFVDAEEFSGGTEVSGRYKIDGDKVTVSVTLYDGEKERAAFTVEGVASKPDELASKIAAEVEKRLAGK